MTYLVRFFLWIIITSVSVAQSAASLFNHQSFTLANGLKVFILPNHLSPLIHVGLYYKVGTADDAPEEHGLSHFLEHMMFKGTEMIPRGMLDTLLLQQGVAYNAHTTPDYTCYEATFAKNQLELILFLEADRMTHLNFTRADIESERKVVFEERAMRLDNHPFGKVIEIYLRSLYWKHPYGIPAIGYPENIAHYSFESVRKHYETYYTPNNAILIIAGDTNSATVKPLVEKYFGPIPFKKVPERLRPKEPSHEGTVIRIEHTDARNHAIVLQYSYHAPSAVSEGKRHALPLILLTQILSGNELSRLWQKFVNQEKIAVNIDFSYDPWSIDPETLDIIMTLNEGVTKKYAEKRLEEEIQLLLKKGVTPEELAHAKRDILASLAFIKDGLESTVQMFSRVVFGVPEEDIEHFDQRIEAVTLEQVNEAIHDVFDKKPEVILTLLPKGYDLSKEDTPPLAQSLWNALRSIF